MRTKTLMICGVVVIAAACSREEAPTVSAATAAEQGACVERASAAYGIGLEYISLGEIGEDPTGAYPYALPGTAARAAGQTTTFLCRLDINRNLADVVTFQAAS